MKYLKSKQCFQHLKIWELYCVRQTYNYSYDQEYNLIVIFAVVIILAIILICIEINITAELNLDSLLKPHLLHDLIGFLTQPNSYSDCMVGLYSDFTGWTGLTDPTYNGHVICKSNKYSVFPCFWDHFLCLFSWKWNYTVQILLNKSWKLISISFLRWNEHYESKKPTILQVSLLIEV